MERAGPDQPAAGRRRRGLLVLGLRGEPLPRLRLAARQRVDRPPAPEDRPGDQGPGRPPLHHRAQPRERQARRAGPPPRRARARRPRHGVLHQRRRRGQRERHADGATAHRPQQDHGAVPLLPRRNARGDHGDRRSAPLAVRAGAARVRAVRGPVPLPLVVPRDDAGGGVRPRPRPRRGDPAVRGPADRGRHHGRAHRRDQRHPRAARRLLAGAPRDHAQARDPADLRRGHGGLRPRRRVVRLPDLGRRAGPHHLRQGHQLGLRPARRAC